MTVKAYQIEESMLRDPAASPNGENYIRGWNDAVASVVKVMRHEEEWDDKMRRMAELATLADRETING